MEYFIFIMTHEIVKIYHNIFSGNKILRLVFLRKIIINYFAESSKVISCNKS